MNFLCRINYHDWREWEDCGLVDEVTDKIEMSFDGIARSFPFIRKRNLIKRQCKNCRFPQSKLLATFEEVEAKKGETHE
jgi:hypothetical protein